MTDDAAKRLRKFAVNHADNDVAWDISDVLDELGRLRKDVAKLGEHVAPVDDREPMDVNWAAEELYAYVAKRSSESQFGNRLLAVLDSRQSWRYKAFRLGDEVEPLRAQMAEATALLGHFVDHEDQPCRLDHHGACQEHGGSSLRPCDVAAGRKWLARIRGVGGELGCLCPHTYQPDGRLVRDGVLAVGCPVHDPDAEEPACGG